MLFSPPKRIGSPAVANAIGVDGRPWPEDELADVLETAVDVAAHVVGAVRLEGGRSVRGAGQDPVAEA